jgi:hypothetical protein
MSPNKTDSYFADSAMATPKENNRQPQQCADRIMPSQVIIENYLQLAVLLITCHCF